MFPSDRDPELDLLATLLGKALCVQCLADRLGVSPKRVEAGLRAIGRTRTVTTQAGRCMSCLKETEVRRAS